MRVLIVEDETRIAADLRAALQRAGYVVEQSADGADALYRGCNESFDAVVLDLGLPNLDGLSVLRRWRAAGKVMPVIVLTARADWQDKVAGIDAGADDYLAKPFMVEELLARLRSITRRAAGLSSAMLRAGRIELDTRTRAATLDGCSLALTPLEYRLLSFMMHTGGRVVSQAELAEHLYPDADEHDSNPIEVLIARLRRKLPPDAIETRRGHGYLLRYPPSQSRG